MLAYTQRSQICQRLRQGNQKAPVISRY